MMDAIKFWLAKEIAEMAFGVGLFLLVVLIACVYVWYDNRRNHNDSLRM